MFTVKSLSTIDRQRQRGVALIELVMVIVIISVAVAGILLVMSYSGMHSGDAQLRKQAISIAEGLLEEIENSHYTYCDAADPQAPYATAAVVGAMGPQPAGSTTGSGGCTSAALVEQPGPESGNTRPFDNINDYVAALGTPQTMSITDVNSNLVSGIVGAYAATVTVSKATLPGMTTDPGANSAIGSALLITVTVTYQGGSVTLDGYRTQYAPQLVP